MNGRMLRRLLRGYALVLLIACVAVRTWFSLSTQASASVGNLVVETWWKGGQRIGRHVYAGDREVTTGRPRYEAPRDAWVADETIVGEGPIYLNPFPLFTFGLVPGRDGVKATLGGKVAYATVDDLMGLQAYDRAHVWVDASFGIGTHLPTALNVLSEQLGVSASEVAERATFRRVRFERGAYKAPATPLPSSVVMGARLPDPMHSRPERITTNDLTRDLVLDALAEAATHLARGVDARGTFRYMVDAPTNVTLQGYNWPRHSGATFLLAQAAAVLDDPFIRYASLRAAARLRDQMMRDCGTHRCISEDEPSAEIGSSALALIAFTEIVRTGADTTYRPAIAQLSAFLRSQQRPDGELMHFYDRVEKKPVDIQLLYYTGEAALALARAHTITGDPRDLDASRRALARLSGAGWNFFGSRYYFSEEHWTCQAVAELWERAPDEAALSFCSRWHEYQRRLQLGASDTPFDAEGSFGFGPLMSPRITPASSRGEAAGALVDVLFRERHAGRHGRDAELVLAEQELRRALAFVLRSQFHPGPAYLFADPMAVRGAVPGSPVDWQLRIDYAQHAGSMMVRWLELDALAAAAGRP